MSFWKSTRASFQEGEEELVELPVHADRVLDLGEQGCGQLVMEIMLAMRELTPGQTLLVIAYDPAAAVDIAAWCRMTGNTLRPLVDAAGHEFLLQKGL